jgi:hypothetical protein
MSHSFGPLVLGMSSLLCGTKGRRINDLAPCHVTSAVVCVLVSPAVTTVVVRGGCEFSKVH